MKKLMYKLLRFDEKLIIGNIRDLMDKQPLLLNVIFDFKQKKKTNLDEYIHMAHLMI